MQALKKELLQSQQSHQKRPSLSLGWRNRFPRTQVSGPVILAGCASACYVSGLQFPESRFTNSCAMFTELWKTF